MQLASGEDDRQTQCVCDFDRERTGPNDKAAPRQEARSGQIVNLMRAPILRSPSILLLALDLPAVSVGRAYF
jgi:hypothetical protein